MLITTPLIDTATQIAYRVIGNGIPILFIHGWTMSGDVETSDFEAIFSAQSGYQRVYIDLPGMGQSPMGDVQDLDSMLEYLSRFVQQNLLPSKFLLVGSSCGAYFARALAYKHAGYVEGLLLRVPLVEPASSKRDVDPFVPAVPDETLELSLSLADRKLLGNIPVQTREYINTLRHKIVDIWMPAIGASDSPKLGQIRDDPNRYRLTATMHSEVDPFTKPTLIVTGRQDTDVGYRDSWSLLPAYSRATFVTLDRADHGLPVDQMRLFSALVEDWLWRTQETSRLDDVKVC